ncbi:hypothetical protein HY213_05370 [Candidatus Peregrinibacteria bacterium]|nr:hypothetical protein [Candidatus Peregrinibacteria bacterium]
MTKGKNGDTGGGDPEQYPDFDVLRRGGDGKVHHQQEQVKGKMRTLLLTGGMTAAVILAFAAALGIRGIRQKAADAWALAEKFHDERKKLEENDERTTRMIEASDLCAKARTLAEKTDLSQDDPETIRIRLEIIPLLKKAVALDPENNDAVKLFFTAMRHQSADDTLALWNSYVEGARQAGNDRVLINRVYFRALLFEQKEQWGQAIADYTTGIEAAKRIGKMHEERVLFLRRAENFERLEKFKEAEVDAEEASRDHRYDAEAHEILRRIREKK